MNKKVKTKNLIGLKISKIKKTIKHKKKIGQPILIEEAVLSSIERRKENSINLSIHQINTSEAQIFNGIDELNIMDKVCIYWKMGVSSKVAAIQSGTSPSTLSRYVKNNPEWQDLRDAFRETPFVNSQIAIAKRLKYYADSKNGELKESLKYAQAVKGDDFALGTKTINFKQDIQFEKDQKEAFALMDNDTEI